MICVLLLFEVGFSIPLVGLFPVGFFGMVVEDSSRIILLFQWFQKGLWRKHKTWCILPAAPYQFPWQLSQCLGAGLSFSLCLLRKPLKMISLPQLNHIRALPVLVYLGFVPASSLLLPSCCTGHFINHKFPLDSSKSVWVLQVKLVLFFGTRIFSHRWGLECALVLLDLWYTKNSSLASWCSENQPMVNIDLPMRLSLPPAPPKGWESVKHFQCLLLLASDVLI